LGGHEEVEEGDQGDIDGGEEGLTFLRVFIYTNYTISVAIPAEYIICIDVSPVRNGVWSIRGRAIALHFRLHAVFSFYRGDE
jgi:hypothetical protein